MSKRKRDTSAFSGNSEQIRRTRSSPSEENLSEEIPEQQEDYKELYLSAQKLIMAHEENEEKLRMQIEAEARKRKITEEKLRMAKIKEEKMMKENKKLRENLADTDRRNFALMVRNEEKEKEIKKLESATKSSAPRIQDLTFHSCLTHSSSHVPTNITVSYKVQSFSYKMKVNFTQATRDECIFDATVNGFCRDRTREVQIVSEAAVVSTVTSHILHILYAAGLSRGFSIAQEVGKLGLRPDIYILRDVSGNPVGVIEVKKPYMVGGRRTGTPLTEVGVLGQINDYLMLLQSMHGVDHPIGIVTTMAELRVCWLGELPDYKNSWGGEFGVVTVDPLDTGVQFPRDEHILNVSPIISIAKNADILNEVVATTLYAMTLCKTQPSWNPFKDHHSKKIYIGIKETERDLVWTSQPNSLNIPGKYELPMMPKLTCKNLILLKSLGVGAHGYTWLACSPSGRLCVLKFQHLSHGGDDQEKKKLIGEEHKVWEKVHPELNARVRTWRGQDALVMPYLAQASLVSSALIRAAVDPKDPKTLAAVEEELNNFASKDIEHLDVKWGNIGFYLNVENKLKAVLIDHAYVKDHARITPPKKVNVKTWGKDSWVKASMENLKLEMLGPNTSRRDVKKVKSEK